MAGAGTLEMIWHVAASFFILASPFLAFLKRYDYSYVRIEALLCFGVIAATAVIAGILASRWKGAIPITLAAMITLFIDVQSGVMTNAYALLAAFIVLWAALAPFRAYATRVLAIAGAVTFVATQLVPVSADEEHSFAGARASGSARLPVIVQIVLDEHIGIEGIPQDAGGTELANELRQFYDRRRFVLFGGAYSEYFDTFRSIAHELNFSPGRHVADLYSQDGKSHAWTLRRNAYFQKLVRDGYAVTVYESTFLDVCGDEQGLARCESYDHAGLLELQSASLAAADKASVVLDLYLVRTRLYRELAFQYRRVRSNLLKKGIRLPVWHNKANTVSPLVTMKTMRRLAREVATASPGDYIFAHLLLPHAPYLFDAHCNLLPSDEWLTRTSARASYGTMNTAGSRNRRYGRYAEQVRCVYRQLDEILDGLPSNLKEDAIFIVQGDHGSRIAISDPDSLPERPSVEPRDYVDSYSTLFAVRAPKLAPGYDERPVSIACLLKALVEADYGNTAGIAACSSEPAVFLADRNGQLAPWPLVGFD